MEKARLLAPVTVGELKKRRFLSAGSTANPWYLKIPWANQLSWDAGVR